MTTKAKKILADVARLIQDELAQVNRPDPSRAEALLTERQEIEQDKEGWMRSLARFDLPDAVRRQIEASFAAAEARIVEISELLEELEFAERRSELTVDEEEVGEKLGSLQETLSGENATVMNFHLAQHIDRVECGADGKVIVRISKLGILPNAAELIARLAAQTERAKPIRSKSKRQVRKRSKLAVDQEGTFLEHCETLEFALDPHRFAGLPDHLFWVVELIIPQQLCWAKRHAMEVYQRRINSDAKKLTLASLAKIFDKSIPTIRKALRLAEASLRESDAA